METLFELTFQDQTLNPQVGTFTDTSQTTGTFTLEDGEYYLTNGDTKGFYTYKPIAPQSGVVDDSKVIIEFDLKVAAASVNTHTIIGTYAGVDGSGIPTGAKITLQYNAGDIELVLGSGTTETLIESADVVVDQWYHFRIDCALAPTESTYEVKIDGTAVTTVTGATTDYELGIIGVLGTDLHACDECGIKNITLVTETNLYVGRTALDQALQDVKGYVDNQVGACVPLAGSNAISGSLIPSTDNSIDVGSSTKNIKMLYTKGITIDGKTIDTDANGNLVYDGNIVDTIEEQGTGYIRYSNGIQICWGIVTNNNNIDTGVSIYTLPKAFNNSTYSLILTAQSNAVYYCSVMESDTAGTVYKTATQFGVFFCDRAINLMGLALTCNYIALGTWK